MGEPQWSENTPHASWEPSPCRVLLLCSDADRTRAQMSRPMLERQGLQIDVVCALHDPRAVAAVVSSISRSTLIAVVVSPMFDRTCARPALDVLAQTPGLGLRLFVLDLQRDPSVSRQCRAVSRAVEGLRHTSEIERSSGGGLTNSASRCATSQGSIEVGSSASVGSGLRVVHPPLLIQCPLHEAAEVIPAGYRVEVPRRVRPRATAETRPELAANDLPQPYAG